MSNINNISSNGILPRTDRIDPRTSPASREAAAPAAGSTATPRTDEVQISSAARRLNALNGNEGAVRPELVERIRSEVAEGSYLTDEKLDKALDALIDRIQFEG